MKLLNKAVFAVFAGLALSAVQVQAAPAAGKAKNVILMISDGAGINTWRAASYYRHGALGKEVYDKFPVQLFVSTHPLNTSKQPTFSNRNAVRFDSKKLWDNKRSDAQYKGEKASYPSRFAGYHYAQNDFTDSAAAATALATGMKTYNNAIGWSNNDKPLKNIGEYVANSGKTLGVLTSVQWSHATPAGFLSHNRSRNNYAEIAKEAVESERADVIMGAGHPKFDKNGLPTAAGDDKAYQYVGGKETWDKLAAGKTPYKLIESKQDFINLANGKLDLGGKTKILGTAQNHTTLQFDRNGNAAGGQLANQPDLTMTKGALNVVSRNPKGFFLMVEGGAVDWAAHANNLPQLVEEQIDFNRAVEAAVDWVEKNSPWNDTLIMVTTDHGNGFLQGTDSERNFYSPIVNQGAGRLPLARWHTDNHTLEPVPVYAQGAGAEYLLAAARPEPKLGTYFNVPRPAQKFVDNTHIFRTVMHALGLRRH